MARIDPKTGGSIWWDPREADWWVALSFTIGSGCFVVGSTPGYQQLVGTDAEGITYFVGSLFFTTAAWLQVLVSTGAIGRGIRTRRAARWRTVARAPRRAEWWAGIVQFAGTLCFNVSTFLALQHSLTARQADHRVWAPDLLGSIAFLVASTLAYTGVRRPRVTWRPRDLDWSVATLNMVGSIAFMASALAAYVVEDGSLRNAQLANSGTWIGGACFLLGAVLLIPEEIGSTDGSARGSLTSPGLMPE